MFALLFLLIMLGIPAGILMLITEVLINYTRSKETKARLEDLIPRRDTSKDTSFLDLQNTVGGKRQDQKQYQYEYTYNEPGKEEKGRTAGSTESVQHVPEPYARPVRKRRNGSAAAVTLFVFSGMTFFTAASDIFDGIAEHGLSHMTEFAGSVPMLLVSIACLIAGLWIVISRQRRVDRENRYIAIINQGYGMIPIDNISYLYPKSYDDCVKELQEMINKGTLPDAYIDYGRRLLVIDPKNHSVEPLIVKKEEKKAPEKKEEAPEKPEKIDFLSMERLSREVKDEEIRLKVTKISTTLKTIGQKAEEDPEIRKAAGVDAFMEMYLPRTINLVRQYEEVNEAANLPEDNELRKNVLETLDAIDSAAVSLWQEIVHSDMIDISSELDALQTKLAMDGYPDSGEKQPDVFDQIRKQREKAPENIEAK